MSSRKRTPASDTEGMFSGVVAFFRPKFVQPRRLQVWKQRLVQMGGAIADRLSEDATHILAMDEAALLQQMSLETLRQFKGKVVGFKWLEESLKSGERVSEHPFLLNFEEAKELKDSAMSTKSHITDAVGNELLHAKKQKILSENVETIVDGGSGSFTDIAESPQSANADNSEKGPDHQRSCQPKEQSSTYQPPNLNKNITEIFGKLISIYRALGDDRRSFSYYKAIPVIEKLPYKIESVDQVKGLPSIGKSLQDHINEIVTTGKLSKLEHFENDEKVKTISLFGEVWGVGPATALKFYEKGYRTLDDLQNEDSLTYAQRIGLKFFNDIQQRIPRHEVADMEALVRKVGEDILPGVMVICGGSYRRGKASCGDMDIVITHPDGKSHIGFLPKLVRSLKDIDFLKEDLVFTVHSIGGTDAGVDTYFGLCTYPGRELRHRIDLKVYPRNRYAFGLIAWTGNDVLNRRLRLLAESKGYRLDDTGLYLATQGSDGKRAMSSHVMVDCNTEKDVFDVLQYPWLEPHERNL